MKSVYNFVVKPKGERYNNTKKLDGGELILNTEIFNHQYVNREAKVISIPIIGNTDIKTGIMVNLLIPNRNIPNPTNKEGNDMIWGFLLRNKPAKMKFIPSTA